MKQKLDLDRLHAVLRGEATGKGAGTTTATANMIAGYIAVGKESRVYITIPSAHALSYILPILSEQVEFMGTKHLVATNRYLHRLKRADGTKVRLKFVIEKEAYNRMRGVRADEDTAIYKIA